MTSNEKTAVVLLSGGLDSTVLLHLVAQRLHSGPVHAVSFNYGQRHARELECARKQVELVGIATHQIIDISFLGELLKNNTALVAGGPPIPNLAELSDADRSQPPTYVPNRNMLLLSLAAAYAEANKIDDVYYGAQAQDEYGYWDCTRSFLKQINEVLSLNRRTPVTVHAPLIDNDKADNVRLGMELGVDFAQTWTCYRGDTIPCASCPTCVERHKAFSALDLRDPLLP
jgi:7-cyano-7-deazaguanine synthase